MFFRPGAPLLRHNPHMGRLSRVWMALLCLAGTVACAKVQARVPPPAPPPPALTIATPPEVLVVPAPLVERTLLPVADPSPSSSKPATPPSSRTNDRVTPPAGPPSQAPPEPPPPQALQTTANVGEIERKAIESLDLARKDLDRVDYNNLGKDAREQYDNAKRMMNVAYSALAIKNYRLAFQMAGKAAAMASLLVKG